MIKKILTTLLLCLIGLSSYGDAKLKYSYVKGDNKLPLKAQRTTRVLQKYFPDEIDRKIVINTILGFTRERRTSKTSGWIDIDQIETLCINGGYDLTKSEDQKKCINFVRAFVALTLDEYYEVCGKDAHVKGITAHCIDNVFYHTQVTMLEAPGLAKEYVRINKNKYNNDVIECSDTYRDNNAAIAPDDFIKCRSVTEPIYYEFKFDDVEEHKDVVADESLEATICALYGEEYIRQYTIHEAYAGNGQKIRDYEHVPARCNTADSSKCKLINVTANKFARKTTFKNGTCFIEERDSLFIDNLRTAFGIDNKRFRNGIQMMSSANMEEKLCEYIMNTANTTITDCFCDSSKQRVYDFSGVITEADDVYTCFANNEPIDFLFNDLNESNKTLQQGGLEAFNCSSLGGEYQGKTCYVPNAELCKKIADATIADCPECAKAYFDTKMNACVLPNATAAVEHQKKINVALISGGAVLGATIVIYTGGTGFAVTAIVLETIGAGMELGAQLHIDGIADEFFIKANNCNDATCAESILREFFQYLSRMTNDLDDGELSGIESQMARLIGLLPDDSQFLIDTVAGCYKDNGDNFDISKCDDGVWNNDQIIRAVGIGLQFTSVFASVGKWLLGAGRVQKIVSKTPNLTKALNKKIPGVQQMIEKAISNGQDFPYSEIILRSHKYAQEHKKYVQTVENSGPDGKRWVELWRKNAPSNESLMHFQEQFGGDLARAEARYGNINTIELWNNYETAQNAYISKYGDTWQEYFSLRSTTEEPLTVEQMKGWTKEQLSTAEDMYREYQMYNDAVCGNAGYCTFDPKTNKINKKYEFVREEMSKKISELQEDYIKKHGEIDENFYQTTEYNLLEEEYGPVIREYMKEMATNVQLPNKLIVADELKSNFDALMSEFPNLDERLWSWESLSNAGKQDLLQEIISKYAAKYNTPNIPIFIKEVPPSMLDNALEGGHYSAQTKSIVINILAPEVKDGTPDIIKSVLLHEYEHAITDIMPNKSALGSQPVTKFYTSKSIEYYLSLQEQGAFAVSNVFRSGGDNPLLLAIKNAQTPTEISLAKEVMIKDLDLLGFKFNADNTITLQSDMIKQGLESDNFEQFLRSKYNDITTIRDNLGWYNGAKDESINAFIKALDDNCGTLHSAIRSILSVTDSGYVFGAKSDDLFSLIAKMGIDISPEFSLRKYISDGNVSAIEEYADIWADALNIYTRQMNAVMENPITRQILTDSGLYDQFNTDIANARKYIEQIRNGQLEEIKHLSSVKVK